MGIQCVGRGDGYFPPQKKCVLHNASVVPPPCCRHHGRGGAVMSGLRQDVPALLPLPALQRQRTVAVLLQLNRGRCVRDGRGATFALPPAAGAHHPVSAHTGRKGGGQMPDNSAREDC